MGQYVAYHVHSDYSILDSVTNFEDYLKEAQKNGQTAIAFSEHGNIFNWVHKKMTTEKYGIKYIHACEVYLTESLGNKVRDNYHTILIAKNEKGVYELNEIVSKANEPDHFYFNPRISFDEFLSISDNIISTSSCLASPLMRLPEDHKYYDALCNKYTYFEIQPHDLDAQKEYNRKLVRLSKKYNKPLIAGTDTHSSTRYKDECRNIIKKAKKMAYEDEDALDLSYQSYESLVEMFKIQNALDESVYLEAINNTNVMADSVEEFKLDMSFKYPKLYDNDIEIFEQRIKSMFDYKVKHNIIYPHQIDAFNEAIKEEMRVFKKIGMCSFMLFMSELTEFCNNNNIPYGFGRGSVGGSRIAYVLDIIDVNPETWNTVFSRFANEDRIEIGDIDMDFAPDDREAVYNYIISRFGKRYTSYIATFGTAKDKGTIDEIARALGYDLGLTATIKEEFEKNPDKTRAKHKDLFYYFDGINGAIVSTGCHAAGMIASPITLPDFCGVSYKDGLYISQIDMDCVHEIGLVKYDILGLKNIGVISDTCKLAGIKYPKSHEINWDDQEVWADIRSHKTGIFQFEADYAFSLLKTFQTKSIFDMSLVTAALRPSGESYRDDLMNHIPNKNPSPIIDELLKDNMNYLVYQEDVIAFLQQICGMSGSEADNLRRAIGRKDYDRLQKALPRVLEGYCSKSTQPREIAEEEAKQFIKIIEDASSYMFGKNHSVAYCMLGYLCGYLRKYYPLEFIASYLNNATTDSDISDGTDLAKHYKISIERPRFRYSKAMYFVDKENNAIYKGVGSIKFLNKEIADLLYEFKNRKYYSFIDVLSDLKTTPINARQIDILIKLDYFSEFGNSKYLLNVYKLWEFFKQGIAKVIDRDKVECEVLRGIIERHSSITAKRYSNLDNMAIMTEYSEYLKMRDSEDVSIAQKIEWQKEYLGYVDFKTDKPEDRTTLIVLETKNLLAKATRKPWAVATTFISLGSGKVSEVLIMSNVFKNAPLNKYDVIKINTKALYSKEYNGRKSWYLNNYVKVDM